MRMSKMARKIIRECITCQCVFRHRHTEWHHKKMGHTVIKYEKKELSTSNEMQYRTHMERFLEDEIVEYQPFSMDAGNQDTSKNKEAMEESTR